MITVLCKKLNSFSQKIYDRIVDSIPLFSVQCTCGAKGCLIRYGHYRRNVKLFSNLITLVVQRVWCKQCGTSHAILLSAFVPYSQICLNDQQQVLIHTANTMIVTSMTAKNKILRTISDMFLISKIGRAHV